MNQLSVSLVSTQRWKVRTAFAFILIAGLLMWFDPLISELLGLSRYAPTMIGTLLGLATLIITSLAVRCQSCRTSLVWFALSKKPTNSWLHWLLSETTCPRCGYQATERAPEDASVQ